jgi:hypothetical protein
VGINYKATYSLSIPAEYKHAAQQIQNDYPTKMTVNQYEDTVDIVAEHPVYLIEVLEAISKLV